MRYLQLRVKKAVDTACVGVSFDTSETRAMEGFWCLRKTSREAVDEHNAMLNQENDVEVELTDESNRH